MCAYVSLHESMCNVHVQESVSPEEGVRSSGSGVPGVCELPSEG